MLKKLLIISIIILSAYFINGGWAQNTGELYRNYKNSKMPLRQFIQTLMKDLR